MFKRFPLLSILSIIIQLLGWLLIAVGLISIVLLLGGHGIAAVSGLLIGPSFILLGVFCVACAEGLAVLMAIESNTRKAAEVLKTALEMDKRRVPPTSTAKSGS